MSALVIAWLFWVGSACFFVACSINLWAALNP